MKKALRFIYHAAIVFAFLLAIAAGFTQTNVFHSYLRSTLIEEVTRSINGSLSVAAVEGNLFTGVRLEDVRLSTAEGSVFQADRISIQYDPLGLLIRRVVIRELAITSPRIRLWRGMDSVWNVQELIPPSEEDTARSAWSISARKIVLEQGSISVVDSVALYAHKLDTSTTRYPRAVDFAQIRAEDVNLSLSLLVDQGRLLCTIDRLGLTLPDPRFEIRQFQGSFSLNDRDVSARSVLLQTGQSHIRLDAEMHGVPPFEIRSMDELRTARVGLDLRADSISTEELQQFLPGPLGFLRRSLGLEVQASGTFRSLSVDKAILRTPRTFLRLQGTIANLDHPRDLYLEVKARNAILDLRDAPEYLPGLDLPVLDSLGSVTCDLEYTGKPLDFSASVTALRQQSRIVAQAKMNIERNVPEYEYHVTAQEVDLAPILRDSAFTSRLNCTASFKGSGFDPRTMRALFRFEVDSSEFWSLPISRSALVMDISEGVIRSHLSLTPSMSRISLTGTLSAASKDSTSFAFNGSVQSLDLAGITRVPRLTSDLSFQVQADGSIREGNLQRGFSQVIFRRSSLGNDQFDGGTVSLDYNGQDSLNRSLALRSDIAELFVDGSFQPGPFFRGLMSGSRFLSDAIQQRMRSEEPLSIHHEVNAPAPMLMPPQTNARVLLAISDFYPIGLLLGEPLEGAALLEATVGGGPDSADIVGTLDIPELSVGRVEPLQLAYSSLEFRLANIRSATTLDSLEGRLLLSSDLIALGSTNLEEVTSAIQFAGDTLSYSLGALVDSLALAGVEGSAIHRPAGYHVIMPVVRAAFSDYVVQNSEPVDLLWSREGLLIQSASFEHEGETAVITGLLHPDKRSNLNIEIEDFLLNNLRSFSRDPVAVSTFSRYTGILRATVDLEGSLQEPHWSFGLDAEGVRVRETVLGQIIGTGFYADGISSLNISFRSNPQQTSSPPDLVINGTIPFRTGSGERAESASDRAMNLDVKSSNFSLDILDAFIPVVRNLTGRVTCDVRIRGTLRKPSYQGNLRLQGARFLFTPLNLVYLFDGELVPSGDQIALQNVVVRNTPEDRPDGRATVSGLLTLEGVTLKQFDLRANGQLLVMKESAAPSRETLYGDLFASTGPDGIHWRGVPSLSTLSGDIYIRNANLSLPPGRESFAEQDRRIDYLFVDDTVQVASASKDRRTLSQQLSDRMQAGREASQRTTAPVPQGTASSGSFLDNIVYNLTIETRGLTQLRIIINQLTNEILFADLKGRLVFNRDKQETRLTGEVDVGERSYYNYIRQFRASGRLLFTGDPDNPELDVTATYEGFHHPPTTSTSPDSANVGADKKVIVTLTIKGTRKEPKVTMNMTLIGPNGEALTTPFQDVEADAISFLVSGKFRDELTSQERSSLLTTSLAGIGSTILSGPLTEFVRREFGFIKSVDVLYYGGPIQESTDIRLTGELGDAVYRLGGKVFSDIGNTNVNVQYPMSAVLRSDAWRNFILEYERRVEEFGTYDQRREPTNAIKLLYRITF